ncbi:hypothetical protein TNCV_3653341 [Trichonephila clavipes]|nr:hypothetical protein TNCV_3653341 [Trichonephila clavipes]
MKGYFWYLDKTRIVDSTRHSKPDKKLSRKKRKVLQNCKSLKCYTSALFIVKEWPREPNVVGSSSGTNEHPSCRRGQWTENLCRVSSLPVRVVWYFLERCQFTGVVRVT